MTNQLIKKLENVSLQRILDCSLAGMYIYDFELQVNTYINPQYTNILGHTLESLKKLEQGEFSKLFHPDDLALINDHMEKIIQSKDGEFSEIEYRFYHRKKRWIWCLSRDTVFDRKEDGSVKSLLGTFLDITERKCREEDLENQIENRTIELNNELQERKLAEESLKDNQKFLDSIIEQSPYPTWISDTKGTMIRANPALKKVLNLSDKQLIGKYNAFEDQQIKSEILQILRDALEKGKKTNYELDWIGKESGIDSMEKGNRVYCEGTIFPIYNQKGTITHAVITYKDVSDRKKAEEALLKNEEELRAIVENSVDAIGVSQQGIHRLVNPAYLKMFGYQNAKKLIGKPIFKLIAPDERKRIKQFVDDGIKDRSVSSYYQTKGLKKDCTEFDMEVNVAQYGHENNKNTLVILRDITDRNRIEEQLRQSQKMESIGNLAGGIAHDFNNLLFPIIGMSEMLLEDLPKESLEYENVEEIFHAGKRAGDLVKQILAFSRQSEHKMTPVRVQSVLKEVLKLSRSTIPANIEIKQNIQQNCGLVMANPTQIHQIAMNLITNAYHAVEEINGQLDIELMEITLKDSELPCDELLPGRYIKLSVSDNGRGMTQSTISKIFEPYFTTKKKGKGTGFGLAVVYGIVKEHLGTITVSSEIGIGTIFHVYLPLMKKIKEERDLTAHVVETLTGTEKILIVDDELPVVMLMKQMLKRLGYNVTEQTSA